MEKQIEKLIYVETEKRLAELEADSYTFPASFSKADWFAVCACIGVSLSLIGLCMVGVIV